MTPKEFADWIDRIYATKNDELDCHQVQAALPAIAEAEVKDTQVDPVIVQRVQDHLHQCPDCTEVYDGLKYVLAHDPTDTSAEAYEETMPEETAVAFK